MNAKVEGNNTSRQINIGKQDLSEMNKNGEMFADFLWNDVIIRGTIFHHCSIHKVT